MDNTLLYRLSVYSVVCIINVCIFMCPNTGSYGIINTETKISITIGREIPTKNTHYCIMI